MQQETSDNTAQFYHPAQTNHEVIQELVQVLFEGVSQHMSGNMMMLSPALNIVKLKIKQMDADDADFVVDAVHKISREIEIRTGKRSPYHANKIDVQALQTELVTEAQRGVNIRHDDENYVPKRMRHMGA